MNTDEYLAVVSGGVGMFGVEYVSSGRVAARHRHHNPVKRARALALSGVSFADLAVNAGKTEEEIGTLPFGEWSHAPYVITHRGVDYARLYLVEGTMRTAYRVDGRFASREQYRALLIPSEQDKPAPVGGVITVRMSNLVWVGSPADLHTRDLVAAPVLV